MSESPAPRPSWQFTGRRGTPVHKRSDATAALPPEIRQVVDQLVRERTGDQPAAPAGPGTRTSATPPAAGLRRPATAQSTPVSASPAPTERRAPATADPLTLPTVIPALASTTAPASAEPAPTAPAAPAARRDAAPEPATPELAAPDLATPPVEPTVGADAFPTEQPSMPEPAATKVIDVAGVSVMTEASDIDAPLAEADAVAAAASPEPTPEPEEDAGLLQRTRRLIGLPRRRGSRTEEPAATKASTVESQPVAEPAPREVPAAEAALASTPFAAVEPAELDAPAWPLDADMPELDEPAPASDATFPTEATEPAPAADALGDSGTGTILPKQESVAPAEAPVAAEPGADAVPTQPAPTQPAPAATRTAQLPEPIAGMESARTAGSLVGQPPIIAELASAPAPEPASPRVEPAAPAAEVTDEAPDVEPSAAQSTDAEDAAPAEATPTPAARADAEPAAPKSVRPRGGKRGGKRKRGSLAWESARPRTPIEPDEAAPAPRSQARTSAPDAIARLDAPLYTPTERTMDEPRFTRQRAVARRSELDVALSDLDAFVDTTGSRRR